MPRRLRNRFTFLVERFILGGPMNRLLVIGVLIGLVSLAGGLVVHWLAGGFAGPGEAVWWAFLRLTDPGYLGDDQGDLRRTISTVVTVLGYVLFLGALIAIMTQWLNATIARLQSGLTPIAQNDHIVILGWTNRTPTIIHELLVSEERVGRFLDRLGASRLRVVVLAEEVTPELLQELRDRLGPLWNPRQIIFRSGTPLRMEHLHRVDFRNAAVIMLPAHDTAGGVAAVSSDGQTIKALLSASGAGTDLEPEEMPMMVAEIIDARKLPVARRAYAGPIEVIASDLVVSRLIAQNVMHPGLSYVYLELLRHGAGNEIYVRTEPQFAGRRLRDLQDAFPQAVLLGVTRRVGHTFEPRLDPAGELVLAADDRLVLMGPSYSACAAAPGFRPRESRRGIASRRLGGVDRSRRILLLGWNHKVPATVMEFEEYRNGTIAIDALSMLPVADRERIFARQGAAPERVELRHVEGDLTSLTDLGRLDPSSYDTVIFLASDRLDTDQESDARSLLGYLMLEELLGGAPRRPEILVELMEESNARLFRRHRAEVIISPIVMSHILTQVALRPELRGVFDELFGSGGAEIFFRPAGEYGVVGTPVTFRGIQRATESVGEVGLGIRFHAEREAEHGGVLLNPPPERLWTLAEGDEIVVMSDSEE